MPTISRELVVTTTGRQFIVEGNPAIGYELVEVLEVAHRGEYQRKWQAKEMIATITRAVG